MSDNARSNSLSPDDALPPVEPPSARFLVQLFLIPGIIVAIIVAVWLLFHWLAQMGNDPKKYIQQLRGHGETRWQAAVNLAGALRSSQNDALRRDPTVAAELSQILRDEIATGSMEERPLNMREYLCLALGQMATDAALPVLLEAATTQRDPAEAAVRLAALKAIGDLAVNLRAAGGESLSEPKLMSTLLAASRDDDPPLRAAAALALAAVGGPESTERLQQLLNDTEPEVRYDSAVALAISGNLQALPTLIEMLDEDQSVVLDPLLRKLRANRQGGNAVQEKKLLDEQRKLIYVSSLRAIGKLAEANPTADLSKAKAPVERLIESTIPEIRENALAVQKKLGGSSDAAH